MFVNGQPVPVTGGAETILIRPKMDFATKNRCMDALAAIGRADGEPDVAVRLGAYQTALLVENIIAWHGPAFDGVPCNAANIARLDPDEPLVEAVLVEIVRRNPLRTEAAGLKKDVTSAGAPHSAELA